MIKAGADRVVGSEPAPLGCPDAVGDLAREWESKGPIILNYGSDRSSLLASVT